MIRIWEGMPKNQVRHHFPSDVRKWCSPGDVIECLLDPLGFKLLVKSEFVFFADIDSGFQQFH